MKQRLSPGGTLEAATPEEIQKLIETGLPAVPFSRRIRARQTFVLDANGNLGGASLGTIQPLTVYKVPMGYSFEARRVTFNLNSAQGPTFPTTGVLALSSAASAVWAAYFRSSEFVCFANPSSANGASIPGVESWGDQQGLYLQNGETFDIAVNGKAAIALAAMTVELEGILTDQFGGDNVRR
jgi:hypothetical protein